LVLRRYGKDVLVPLDGEAQQLAKLAWGDLEEVLVRARVEDSLRHAALIKAVNWVLTSPLLALSPEGLSLSSPAWPQEAQPWYGSLCVWLKLAGLAELPSSHTRHPRKDFQP